jgi:hypothetical protein
MHLIQFVDAATGERGLAVVRGEEIYNVSAANPGLRTVYAAFHSARRKNQRLTTFLEGILSQGLRPASSAYTELLAANRLLPPITEERGVRMLISGTGLTHTGSVQQRDAMHKRAEVEGPKSDSRKMFEMGLVGGRPDPALRGTAPEWFYKGDGRNLRGPGEPLTIPPFAPDGGEEPEIAGIYIVDDHGIPCRLGFAQGNEWSDHITENINYLYLAPSKLRTCAIGPELVTYVAFDDIKGRCRVLREGGVIYDSGELLTGEANMCHSLANIEDHHFKFPEHRRAGDIHVHFFGTSKLSFQHREWRFQTGDVVEVTFDGLGAPLRNPVRREEPDSGRVHVELA